MVCLSSCSPSAPTLRTASELQMETARRTKWRIATTVGEYERVGHKDPKWDEDAKAALESFALMDFKDAQEQSKDYKRAANSAERAVQAGCDDPLIRYYYYMLAFNGEGHKTNEVIDASMKLAGDMTASGYAEIRKFYVCYRTAQWIQNWDRRMQQEVWNLRIQARDHLCAALEDKELPSSEAQPACVEMLQALGRYGNNEDEEAFKRIDGLLLKHFSRTSVPYYVKGLFYLDYAWKARGGGYANSVTPEGWKLYAERLAIAEPALVKAWQMNPSEPSAATEMIRLATDTSKSREEMELWFQRAMAANTNNWDACNHKMRYLYPQWHGSAEEMLAFGRECLTNQAWGGAVTLMIVDAHQAVAAYGGAGTNYWKRPEVWPEIRGAYEEYYRRNPGSELYHHNFAWYAWSYEDWDTLNQQLAFLGEDDYFYFGGKRAFEEMAQNARSHAHK